MPLLVDGNNLLYAMADAGHQLSRAALTRMIAEFAGDRDTAHVVFDGPEPPPDQARLIAQPGRVQVTYAAPRTADHVLIDRIGADSAPRRLTVVSTDREIRTAARHRRCISLRSDEFALAMIKALSRPAPPPPPEPDEKRTGLTPDQTAHWLREFGLDD